MTPTASDAFEIAVTSVLEIEGPMSNDTVNDPYGGLTKYGISQKQHPEIDVANLTKAEAITIYRHQYFDASRCGELPWPIGLMVFDANVNQGYGSGARFLQQALKVKVDGVVGEITLKAALEADAWDLTARMSAKRLVAYTRSSLWPNDGEGWSYRVFKAALTAGRSVPATLVTTGGHESA